MGLSCRETAMDSDTGTTEDLHARPIWNEVLLTVYEKKMVNDSFTDKGSSDLARRASVIESVMEEGSDANGDGFENVDEETVDEIHGAISGLKSNGLIEDPPNRHRNSGYQLTSKGVEISHDLYFKEHIEQARHEKLDQQIDSNRSIAYLTLALVFVGFTQVAMSGATEPNMPDYVPAAVIVLGGVGLIGFISLLQREGLL